MPTERFNRLDTHDLPEGVQGAVSHLERFERLEIGGVHLPPSPSESPGADKIFCAHCGQLNENTRDFCWACTRLVRGKVEPPESTPDEVTLILDGKTYRSNDPNLPPDVQVLMTWIRERGFSQQLLGEWRFWKARANSGTVHQPSANASGIQVMRGGSGIAIRIDGKVYTSDSAAASEELEPIFRYVEERGVTPELMESLRRFGNKVKYRPDTTAHPTDGDLEFWESTWESWKSANAQADARPIADPGPSREQWIAEDELSAARARYRRAWWRTLPTIFFYGLGLILVIVELFRWWSEIMRGFLGR